MNKKYQQCDFCGDYGVVVIETKMEEYSQGKPMRIGCACICKAPTAINLREQNYKDLDDMRRKYSDMTVIERISERQAYSEAMADRGRVRKMNQFVEQQAGKTGW